MESVLEVDGSFREPQENPITLNNLRKNSRYIYTEGSGTMKLGSSSDHKSKGINKNEAKVAQNNLKTLSFPSFMPTLPPLTFKSIESLKWKKDISGFKLKKKNKIILKCWSGS